MKFGCRSCISDACSCCVQTCTCCAVCCICCCESDSPQGQANIPVIRKILNIPSKLVLQDLLKLIALSSERRSDAEMTAAIDSGEMAFGRHIQLIKSVNCSETTAVVFELGTETALTTVSPDTTQKTVFVAAQQRELAIVFNVDVDARKFAQQGCKSARFVEATGISSKTAVHKGTLRLWQSVYEELIPFVQTFVKENPSGIVTMTGFGVGGAVAALHAMFTQTSLIIGDRLQLVTFGATRFANGRYRRSAKKLIKNSFRVVNNRDPVYDLMRRQVFAPSYKGQGQIVHLREDRAYDQYWRGCKRLMLSTDDGDHGVHAYQMRLAAWDGNVSRIAHQ